MTSLAEERAEHRRWMQRLRHPEPFYDRLLENEFETPEQCRARTAQLLGAMLRFTSQQVPYYRGAFGGIDAVDQDPAQALSALPILSKLDVQDAGETLLARMLPAGDGHGRWWQSSGTTGRPVRTLHSLSSERMFGLLAQRSCRWHRLDPAATFADMRIPRLLPRREDGSELGSGETARLPSWHNVQDFNTGPFIGISIMTPVEERIAWLRRERPQYLMTYAETLELIALAAGEEKPAESLKAVIAISEQLTPNMRSYVERRFETPVHQVYGLTEFGLVAIRCEAGRYHVNREHCLVEILDDERRPCGPGETGHIIITGLRNFAMPLLRYDSGDLAEAVGGDCPCGRTLPSFGEIVGRYGRIAFLPPGSMFLVVALRSEIETMPADLVRDLREFQIHQFADRHMEFRSVSRAPLPNAFYARLRAAWAKAAGSNPPELVFVQVDQIARSGGKSEVFTSDFMPPRDGKPTRGASSATGSDGGG